MKKFIQFDKSSSISKKVQWFKKILSLALKKKKPNKTIPNKKEQMIKEKGKESKEKRNSKKKKT